MPPGGPALAFAPVLEFLFEVLGEFILQFFLEALVELGLHTIAEPFRKQPNPKVAALAYAMFGLALGGLSLLLFPDNLVRGSVLQLANLLFTPVAVGAAMAVMGAWRVRRGESPLRIDRFAYGYLFAFAVAAVRFFFAG